MLAVWGGSGERGAGSGAPGAGRRGRGAGSGARAAERVRAPLRPPAYSTDRKCRSGRPLSALSAYIASSARESTSEEETVASSKSA